MSDKNAKERSNEAEFSLGKKGTHGSTGANEPKLMDPHDLIVKIEYKNMYPMSEVDFQKLKQSIEENGQRVPLILNQRFEIIDGYGRTRAGAELGRDVLVEVWHFESVEEEKKTIHILNLARRHLVEYRIKAVALDEDFIKEQARRRQLAGLLRGSSVPLVLNGTDEESGRTDQICADRAGTSLKKYRRVRDLIKRNAIPEQIDLELLEAKADLDKVLDSLAPLIDNKPKKTRQFNGEIIKMSEKATIIRGRFQDLPPLRIPENSLAAVIPSFMFANHKKLANELGIFASQYLEKKGFLVLLVAQDYVGLIADAVTRAARNLKLVYALPVNFPNNWDNRLRYGMTHTVLYLIFGKELEEKAEGESLFGFDEPISINVKVRMREIYPMHANRESAPFLVQGLSLNGRICDPLSVNGHFAWTLLRKGFEVVAMEPDSDKFQGLKELIQSQLEEMDIS